MLEKECKTVYFVKFFFVNYLRGWNIVLFYKLKENFSPYQMFNNPKSENQCHKAVSINIRFKIPVLKFLFVIYYS